jgi:hypothetical protein
MEIGAKCQAPPGRRPAIDLPGAPWGRLILP